MKQEIYYRWARVLSAGEKRHYIYERNEEPIDYIEKLLMHIREDDPLYVKILSVYEELKEEQEEKRKEQDEQEEKERLANRLERFLCLLNKTQKQDTKTYKQALTLFETLNRELDA